MSLKRIREAVALEGYRLKLTLVDGTVIERDVSPRLSGPLFGQLRQDRALFRNVRVEGGSVAWPNGADIRPDVLIWGGPPPVADAPPPAKLRLNSATLTRPA